MKGCKISKSLNIPPHTHTHTHPLHPVCDKRSWYKLEPLYSERLGEAILYFHFLSFQLLQGLQDQKFPTLPCTQTRRFLSMRAG